MQDPEVYLKARGIELASWIDEKRPAVLDASHRARVNHELFFFADEVELKRFKKNPLKHCGVVTDPVNRKRFRPTPSSPRLEYQEQPFYFESEATLEQFAAMPDSFATPRFKMKKMQKTTDSSPR